MNRSIRIRVFSTALVAVASTTLMGSPTVAENKAAVVSVGENTAGEKCITSATIKNAVAFPFTVTLEGDDFIRREIVLPGTHKLILISRPCITVSAVKGLLPSGSATMRPQSNYYDYARRLADRSKPTTAVSPSTSATQGAALDAAAIAASMVTSSAVPTSQPAPSPEEEGSASAPVMVIPPFVKSVPATQPASDPRVGANIVTRATTIAYPTSTGSGTVLGTGKYCGSAGGGVFSLATGITVLLDVSTVVNCGACEEGAWRWKNEVVVKSCAFDAPTVDAPVIEITPVMGYGEHADEATRDALGNMADAMGGVVNAWNLAQGAAGVAGRDVTGGQAAGVGGAAAGNATGIDIPTSVGELPAAYATNALRMGQRLADACDRWAQGAANVNVNVRATVPMEHITFDCREIEVCRNGRWVDGGLWNTQPTRTPLSPRTHDVNDVTIDRGAGGRAEINRAIGRIRNWFQGLHLEAAIAKRNALEGGDPCSIDCGEGTGGGANGVSGVPTGGNTRNCQPILNEIRQAESDLAEQQRQLAEHQAGKQTSEASLTAFNTQCATEEAAARDVVESAREVWRRAAQRERDLLADRPPSYASDEDRARYNERVDAAAATSRAADQAFESAQQILDAIEARCARERERLTDDIEFHDSMVGTIRREITRLEALIPVLNTRYRECLGQ